MPHQRHRDPSKKLVTIDDEGHLTIELMNSPGAVPDSPAKQVIDPMDLEVPEKQPDWAEVASPVASDDESTPVARTKSAFEDDNSSQDKSTPAEESMTALVSIAQPLTQHGSVLFSKHGPFTLQQGAAVGGGGSGGERHSRVSSVSEAEIRESIAKASVASPATARASPLPPTAFKLHSLQSYLCTVPHLATLSAQELNSLKVMVREYDAMDVVVEYDTMLSHVYVLVSGTVEVFMKHPRTKQKRVGTITAPNIFGVSGIIFDEPSQFAMRSGSSSTTILLISKAQFLQLLAHNTVLRRSIGAKLVDHMDIFQVFQEFCRSVFAVSSSVVEGTNSYHSSEGYTLNLGAILNSYVNLKNLIHPLINSTRIDTAAWQYASRRLPQNITESFVINLARSLPPFIANELRNNTTEDERSYSFSAGLICDPTREAGITVSYVPTHDRRRCAWRIGDKGNTMVLLREGFTDVLDFVTCLCIHLVEAKKLRLRLQEMVAPSAVEVLQEAIRQMPAPEDLTEAALQQIERQVLEHLPLSKEEQDGLFHIWPHSTLLKLNSILVHREEYVVKIDNSLSKRFDLDPYLQWALTLRRVVLQAMGLSESSPLPDNITIDILSSNTHSTKNLLCSFTRRKKDAILEWASQNRKDVLKSRNQWFNEDDMLYYLQSQMLAVDPALRNEYKTQLRASGFVVIEDTSMTGLQVDVIHTQKLDPLMVDPLLVDVVKGLPRDNPGHFILNMDFAFGAQADGITRALILTFAHRIQSLNVVGKAGGLIGRRGDIQLPTELIFSKAVLGEDTTDEFRSSGNEDLTQARLQELIGDGRSVHVGPVITIPGTLLQNATLLRYYQQVFGCIGLEMEGSYFARQFEESQALELLGRDVRTRFAYYTSDLPMGSADGNLSQKMKPHEGVPPMYAIIRAMLELVLKRERKRATKAIQVAIPKAATAVPPATSAFASIAVAAVAAAKH